MAPWNGNEKALLKKCESKKIREEPTEGRPLKKNKIREGEGRITWYICIRKFERVTKGSHAYKENTNSLLVLDGETKLI